MLESVLFLYELLASIYFTIAGGVQKLGFKKRLSKGLGRKPSDQELVSISTWIRVSDENKSDQAKSPHGNTGSIRTPHAQASKRENI